METTLRRSKASIFKTFLYIALNQPDDGIRGFEIEKPTLAFNLGISQPTISRDLKWLKDNLLIQELKLDEVSDFMANPYHVMNNCERNDRIAEWRRRQRLDIQRETRLYRERFISASRKAKKIDCDKKKLSSDCWSFFYVKNLQR